MSDNLSIYNKVRSVPQEAQKPIESGRLKGKTDINPMWRLKTLTEQFGVCGIGWKYKITDKRLENGANDEISAFVDIDLFIKVDGEWSYAIPGTGGSSFVAKETKGLHTSDECFKMALTDALSVACKALGIGADVYWSADRTKYDKKPDTPPQKPQPEDSNNMVANANSKVTQAQAKAISDRLDKLKSKEYVLNYYKLSKAEDMTVETLSKINNWCNKKEQKAS